MFFSISPKYVIDKPNFSAKSLRVIFLFRRFALIKSPNRILCVFILISSFVADKKIPISMDIYLGLFTGHEFSLNLSLRLRRNRFNDSLIWIITLPEFLYQIESGKNLSCGKSY